MLAIRQSPDVSLVMLSFSLSPSASLCFFIVIGWDLIQRNKRLHLRDGVILFSFDYVREKERQQVMFFLSPISFNERICTKESLLSVTRLMNDWLRSQKRSTSYAGKMHVWSAVFCSHPRSINLFLSRRLFGRENSYWLTDGPRSTLSMPLVSVSCLRNVINWKQKMC